MDIAFVTYEFTSVSLESKSDLVIGIDFGTTFTGVAYAHSGNVTGDDAGRIASEKIEVIRSWPTSSLAYTEKTPTVLAYNKTPPTWGGSVRPKDEHQVAHFKLGLQGNAASHYDRATHEGPSALAFLDSNWKHPTMPQKTAQDFTADYLQCILKYVKEDFFPRQFGDVFLKGQQISYVITVPAIWKEQAKDLTRQAAIRAGIPKNSLELITEPEAAALYCATICREVDLMDGDRFLICDAGGGTVDLISYLVVSRNPFEIEEANIGSGAACGAVYLNKGFEALLRKKMGSRANLLNEKDNRRLNEALRYFENTIKRAFDPLDKNCEDFYEVPLGNSPEVAEIGLEDGHLKVTKFYRPVKI